MTRRGTHTRHALPSRLLPFTALLFILAPWAEASLTRANAPAIESREAPALTLTLAAPEPSEFSLFEGNELAVAAAESEGAPSFHPLAAVSLLSKDGAEPPLVSAEELTYPKTRYRVFQLLGTPILGELRGVSLELRWGSGEFRAGLASGTVGWLSQDPLGDVDSPNLYAFVGMRPHEKTDPLGLCLGFTDGPCSDVADRIRAGFEGAKKAVRRHLGSGAASVATDAAVSTALDVVDTLFVDPLRVGEATGDAVGRGAGAGETALAVVQDVGRGAAVAAGAGSALKAAGRGAKALKGAMEGIAGIAPDISLAPKATGIVPAASGPVGKWGEARLAQVLEGAGTKPKSPYSTSLGKRYIDRLVDGVAHEAKAGVNVKLTSYIEKQILKDAELIETGVIRGAHWHFFRGAQDDVLAKLTEYGIPFTVYP